MMTMKTRSILCVAGYGLAVMFTALTTPAQGTDILHLMVRKTMSNEGVDLNATGDVDAKLTQQGNSSNQKLDIRVGGLNTNDTYQLLAKVEDDTNFVQILNFSSDGNGAASLRYQKKGNGNGNGNGNGHGKSPLPGGLDPLSDIRS